MYLTARTSTQFGTLNSMNISSPVFEHQGKIPAKYTCVGEDINPPLRFENIPADAKSLVLIVDDPDAGGPEPAERATWVHWVVFNIPASVTEIQEHSVPKEGIEGDTSFGKPGYGGPCPPSGEHRYFFKLYALSDMLTFEHLEKMDKQSVEEKMQGKILEQAQLMGLFEK